MSNSFEELLKDHDIGVMSDMSTEATNKSMLMIFIVDISGSMSGARIANVNAAFRQMIPTLKDIQSQVNDAYTLSIAVLAFGSKANFIVEPTPILNYIHSDLDANGGGTDYKAALNLLKSKLSSSAYMKHTGKIAEPYIMLMTDGRPDNNGYESVITELEENGWYRAAQRYAVLIGQNAINDERARSAVKAFVSDPVEGIITAADAQMIVKAVSANTIHTIKGMTMHKQPGSSDFYEKRKNSGSSSTASSISSGDSSGSGLDLDMDVYGGQWKF